MSKPPEAFYHSSVCALLDRLHDESSNQEASIDASARKQVREALKVNLDEGIRLQDNLMRDKFIAFDKDKSLFVYNLILSSGATNIVEIGTSFGVSTIYLALAALENVQGKAGGNVRAKVIGTEKEESKAAIARKYWAEAGKEVEGVIDLRVGDLLQTLRTDIEEVHFILLDIWPYVALPALELLLPKMRDGAIVVTDNTISSAEGYSDLLKALRDEKGPFQSVTLPYSGGLEFSVYKPRTG
ncbi:putative O-methyltransferase [Rhizodiscina lignyota]|uniref:O-methyltransferase n=1 Tax=Rhizodiscina lignyota TaxID=1504668 RepID=A0A9P4ILZ2_9PEZI|nr:putative O-methyltransferase [Rhizodiscina lignyota]